MLDTDPRIVTRMAAEHFLDIGFRNFAYIGFPGVDFSERRLSAYEEYLKSRGMDVHVYSPHPHLQPSTDVLGWEARGELEGAAIAEWLQSLPRPLAVFACNDVRGRQIIDACNQSELSVPEEVAVIGVDDDEVICELSNPPLSSVQPDTLRLGYEGAALLDAMMNGQAAPEETIFIPPKGISHRLSSEATAVDDREVATAMQLIRDHACEGLSRARRRGAAAREPIDAGAAFSCRIPPHAGDGNRTRADVAREAAAHGNTLQAVEDRGDDGLRNRVAIRHRIQAACGLTPGEFRKQTQLFS